jgi:uncharacterized cysteine cluster protein YcgN (CxxCxxCC family)
MSFWTEIKLADMTEAQWESLCDGCGKCCLLRLEDEDTGDIYTTDVACKLLDTTSCRCKDYAGRQKIVPDCVKLTPQNMGELSWLPKTCAYRLVAEGSPLYDWHPLVSGDPGSIHAAGMSVAGKATPEGRVKAKHLIKRIKVWPGEDR